MLAGYKKDKLLVVDPADTNPFTKSGKYFLNAHDLLANIHSHGGYVIAASK